MLVSSPTADPDGLNDTSTDVSGVPVPAADLELLRKYDTPTVCNVVELFDRCARTAFLAMSELPGCHLTSILVQKCRLTH